MKFFSLFFLFLLFLCAGQAAVVTQVKNGKVLIDNQNDEINIGQEFYLLNSSKKKVGLVQISAIKADKSIGMVISGKSEGNEKLIEKSDDPLKKESHDSDLNSTEEKLSLTYRMTSKKISVLINIMANSMLARESNGVPPNPSVDEVQMTGNSFGLSGSMDYPLNNWFEFRIILGYEPFLVSGTSTITGCNNVTSTNCNANISYLATGAYARFDIYKSKTLIWVGFGANSKFPVAKDSTALKISDLKLTSAYGFAAGADYFLNNKLFIPLSLEQQYFLNSDTVKANLLMLRVGVGYAY